MKTRKLDDEKETVDLSLGFSETKRLKIAHPTESTIHHAQGEPRVKYIDLAKPVYEIFSRNLGTHGHSWYFAYKSLKIKYFDNNEWKMDSFWTLLRKFVTGKKGGRNL